MAKSERRSTPDLSHLDARGAARMVDVGDKDRSLRRALARAVVEMSPPTLRAILADRIEKGAALGTARIAGILAAKRTSDLIPLCHPLPLTSVSVDFATLDESRLEIRAEARTVERTGVEMEALAAATVAALTIYDMAKALEKGIRITDVELLEKDGGKSGPYRRSRR